MASLLFDRLVEEWSGAGVLPARDRLLPLLDDLVARGRAASPGIEAPLASVARVLARRLGGVEDAGGALQQVDGAEVWLASACAAGDAEAIALFERRYIAGLEPALKRMRLDDASMDDVRQKVRHKLLMPDDSGVAKIEDYAGEGRLAALVRVVAVRTALDHIRGEKRRPDQAGEVERAADALLGGVVQPDLKLIRQRHSEAFKKAFQDAVQALTPKDRGILRLHLLDRLSIDDIAALHNAHRSSAARWLKAIRESLGVATRKRLQAELSLSADEFESVYRAVDSQLDLSFARILESDST